MINICLDSAKYPKCKNCPHNRFDPERGCNSCYLDTDLVGQERIDYLKRVAEEFKVNN